MLITLLLAACGHSVGSSDVTDSTVVGHDSDSSSTTVPADITSQRTITNIDFDAFTYDTSVEDTEGLEVIVDSLDDTVVTPFTGEVEEGSIAAIDSVDESGCHWISATVEVNGTTVLHDYPTGLSGTWSYLQDWNDDAYEVEFIQNDSEVSVPAFQGTPFTLDGDSFTDGENYGGKTAPDCRSIRMISFYGYTATFTRQ